MADFCTTCVKELSKELGKDWEPDLTIEALKVTPRHWVQALCEGCGNIAILNENGKERIVKENKGFFPLFKIRGKC